MTSIRYSPRITAGLRDSIRVVAAKSAVTEAQIVRYAFEYQSLSVWREGRGALPIWIPEDTLDSMITIRTTADVARAVKSIWMRTRRSMQSDIIRTLLFMGIAICDERGLPFIIERRAALLSR